MPKNAPRLRITPTTAAVTVARAAWRRWLDASASTYGAPVKMKRKLGRKVTLQAGWDSMRVAVMRELLRTKFSDNVLRALLLETGHADLVEGNSWQDVFWGVCRGKGENWLGRLLMEVRREVSRTT